MLTHMQIKAMQPREKPFRLTDGDGLHLLIKPNGARLWRFRYFFEGREKLLSFGSYPLVSLQQARFKKNDARKLLSEGIDPSAKRQAVREGQENTFEPIAREWLALQERKFAPKTYEKTVWTFETLTFPFIGKRPIDRIAAIDVLRLLRRIESRGAHHTAHRTKQRIARRRPRHVAGDLLIRSDTRPSAIVGTTPHRGAAGAQALSV